MIKRPLRFLWLCLLAANLLWALTIDGDYHQAIEQSYFQGLALILVRLGQRIGAL